MPAPSSGKDYWKDAVAVGLYLSVSSEGKRAWECQLKYDGKPRWQRPELERLLGDMEDGVTLIVWKLDRLGRSLQHLLGVVSGFRSRNVNFRSLTEAPTWLVSFFVEKRP